MLATLETTIGQLVTSRPGRARLFESLGLDYCCGGRKPLVQACAEKGMDVATVLRLVHDFDKRVTEVPDENWSGATITALANHIENTHHAYMKTELPRLEHLVRHVAARHGDRNPHLVELRDTFLSFKAKMESHGAREEASVFPACRALDVSGPASILGDGPASTGIAELIAEHEEAGDALSRIRELTNGFTPPADACNTYRVIYSALAEMTEDLHRHVHKENNILFPKALDAKRKLTADSAHGERGNRSGALWTGRST